MAKTHGPSSWVYNPYAGTGSKLRSSLPTAQPGPEGAPPPITEDDVYLAHLAGVSPQEYVSSRNAQIADEVYGNKKMESAGTLQPITRGMPSTYQPTYESNAQSDYQRQLQELQQRAFEDPRLTSAYKTMADLDPRSTTTTAAAKLGSETRDLRAKLADEISRITAMSARFGPRGHALLDEKLSRIRSLEKGENYQVSPAQTMQELELAYTDLGAQNWESLKEAQPLDIGYALDPEGERITHTDGTPLRQYTNEKGEAVRYWEKPVWFDIGGRPYMSLYPGHAELVENDQTTAQEHKREDELTAAKSVQTQMAAWMKLHKDDVVPPSAAEITAQRGAYIDDTVRLLADIRQAQKQLHAGIESGIHPTDDNLAAAHEEKEGVEMNAALTNLKKHVDTENQASDERLRAQSEEMIRQRAENQRQHQLQEAKTNLDQRLGTAKNDSERWAMRVGDWRNNPDMINLARNPVRASTKLDVKNAPMNTIVLHEGVYLYKALVDGHPVLFKMPIYSELPKLPQ